jgi:hypothetical protein|tara:strand:- start:23478 stop:24611 length:1134 start_codon:yes stop_codon:yes gene_type:complete
MKKILIPTLILALTVVSCKKKGCTDELAVNFDKKAQKDNGSCVYENVQTSYSIPSTYNFVDAAGNSTVDYSGQTDRLNQMREMATYIESGETGVLNVQILKDMFSNTNNPFSFTSTKQLKDKCFSLDQTLIESYLDSVAIASQSFAQNASAGQAGTLTSGTSEYLFSANGFDYDELIEKGIMGAVFMHQALNEYFGSTKMNVDNTVAVDPANGKYYTVMAHHWDEAFGYFAVPTDFPTTLGTDFWAEYCNKQNATLGSNAKMMDNFLKGRAAIVNNDYTNRDAAISTIRNTWEAISANQAISYLNSAISYFGNDQAKYLHILSEAYAFSWNLRYAPLETRKMSNVEHTALMSLFGDNLWNLTLTDLNAIKAAITAKY